MPIIRKTYIYEEQWRKMPFVQWQDVFGQDVGTDLSSFWSKVFSYQDAGGSKPFQELAEIVLNMLSVPTSNACVERVFSIMNTTKTKIRNRMQYELLEALLRINTHFKNNSVCCAELIPSSQMLTLFNTSNMYNKIALAEESEDFDSEVFEMINIDT